MPEFAPGYLELLYQQISSISAVLGGFAIATLVLLLDDAPGRRIASCAAGSAGLAAGFLISTTFVASILSTDAMKQGATSLTELTPSVLPLTAIVAYLFPLGIYALLLSLGLSGWIRSKWTGVATSVAAVIGAVCVTVGFAATI